MSTAATTAIACKEQQINRKRIRDKASWWNREKFFVQSRCLFWPLSEQFLCSCTVVCGTAYIFDDSQANLNKKLVFNYMKIWIWINCSDKTAIAIRRNCALNFWWSTELRCLRHKSRLQVVIRLVLSTCHLKPPHRRCSQPFSFSDCLNQLCNSQFNCRKNINK